MDAREILESLDPEQISARLDEIAGERQALMTLLRAARHSQSVKEAVARAAAGIDAGVAAGHEAVYQDLLKSSRQIATKLQADQEGHQ